MEATGNSLGVKHDPSIVNGKLFATDFAGDRNENKQERDLDLSLPWPQNEQLTTQDNLTFRGKEPPSIDHPYRPSSSYAISTITTDDGNVQDTDLVCVDWPGDNPSETKAEFPDYVEADSLSHTTSWSAGFEIPPTHGRFSLEKTRDSSLFSPILESGIERKEDVHGVSLVVPGDTGQRESPSIVLSHVDPEQVNLTGLKPENPNSEFKCDNEITFLLNQKLKRATHLDRNSVSPTNDQTSTASGINDQTIHDLLFTLEHTVPDDLENLFSEMVCETNTNSSMEQIGVSEPADKVDASETNSSASSDCVCLENAQERKGTSPDSKSSEEESDPESDSTCPYGELSSPSDSPVSPPGSSVCLVEDQLDTSEDGLCKTEDSEIAIDQEDSEIAIDQENSEIAIDQEDSEIAIDQEDSEIAIDQDNSKIAIDQQDSEIAIDQEDSEIAIDQENSPVIFQSDTSRSILFGAFQRYLKVTAPAQLNVHEPEIIDLTEEPCTNLKTVMNPPPIEEPIPSVDITKEPHVHLIETAQQGRSVQPKEPTVLVPGKTTLGVKSSTEGKPTLVVDIMEDPDMNVYRIEQSLTRPSAEGNAGKYVNAKEDIRFHTKSRSHRKDQITIKKSQRHERGEHKATNFYRCKTCRKMFLNRSKLKRHLKSHSEVNSCTDGPHKLTLSTKSEPQTLVKGHDDDVPFKCSLCGGAFDLKENMKRHTKAFSPDKPYKCSHCDHTYLEDVKKKHTVGKLKGHIDRESKKAVLNAGEVTPCTTSKSKLKMDPKIPLSNVQTCSVQKCSSSSLQDIAVNKCSVCREVFSLNSELKKHMKNHDTKTTHSCPICREKFFGEKTLAIHVKEHLSRKPLKCSVCFELFYSAGDHEKHMRTHTNGNLFKCSTCDSSFPRLEELGEHLETHMERPYHCSVCNARYCSQRNLRQHLKIHNAEKLFYCSICKRSYSSKAHLERHQLQHRWSKTIKCATCYKYFRTNWDLRTHRIRVHEADKRFECAYCHKSFTSFADRKLHIRIHTGEKPFKCAVCNKTFSQATNLKTHLRAHTGEKPHRCSLCDESFSHNTSLHLHMRKHIGEKPYKCSICGVGCCTPSTCKQHENTHSGEKPFKCVLCTNCYTTKGHLRTHMKTHTGEKPFKCALCDYSCANNPTLLKHMNKHTGEKPFKCTLCEKAFSCKSNLNRHHKTHTGEKYKCHICDKEFTSVTHFKQHVGGHTGETRRYNCTLCDKSFHAKNRFELHLKKHAGEKHFKCSKCGRRFLSENYRRLHMRIHVTVKPFACHICDHRYPIMGSLKKHLITAHSGGVRPYKCSKCKRAFFLKGDLTYHMRKVHSKEKPSQ